jgi:hypothetical protein
MAFIAALFTPLPCAAQGAAGAGAGQATARTAQANPGAAPAQPAADDIPSVKVGGTLFADYTVVQAPEVTDADGNTVVANAFNVGRAYLNVTGRISHLVSFRITPDIFRESGAGSSLNGSYVFRLKYAYAQFTVGQSSTAAGGTWVRLGLQQTPWVDFIEPIYRYRFQGMTFEDREGFSSSSDAGVGFHTDLPGNRGDLEGGIYNGETYARPEVNDQKALMIRGTFRPFVSHAALHGLRASGFYDKDAYVRNADRTRAIVAVTFEHKFLNAAFDHLWATDQRSQTTPAAHAGGYTVWATPRVGNGWEGLIRFDHLQPDREAPGTRVRTIGGVAYWFPHQGTVATALLLDADVMRFRNFAVNQPTQRRFALHALVNF